MVGCVDLTHSPVSTK